MILFDIKVTLIIRRELLRFLIVLMGILVFKFIIFKFWLLRIEGILLVLQFLMLNLVLRILCKVLDMIMRIIIGINIILNLSRQRRRNYTFRITWHVIGEHFLCIILRKHRRFETQLWMWYGISRKWGNLLLRIHILKRKWISKAD